MLLVCTGVTFNECKQTLVCTPLSQSIVLRRAAGQVGKHLLALHHRRNAPLPRPCVRLTESSRLKIVFSSDLKSSRSFFFPYLLR